MTLVLPHSTSRALLCSWARSVVKLDQLVSGDAPCCCAKASRAICIHFARHLQDIYFSSANWFLRSFWPVDLLDSVLFDQLEAPGEKLCLKHRDNSRYSCLHRASLKIFRLLNCGFSHIWLGETSLSGKKKVSFVVSGSGTKPGRKLATDLGAGLIQSYFFVCVLNKASLPVVSSSQWGF